MCQDDFLFKLLKIQSVLNFEIIFGKVTKKFSFYQKKLRTTNVSV